MSWVTGELSLTGWTSSQFYGHGVPSAEVPADGQQGASILYNDSLTYTDNELRFVIVTLPTNGTVTWTEKGEIIYVGDGSADSMVYSLYVDGVYVDDYTVSFTPAGTTVTDNETFTITVNLVEQVRADINQTEQFNSTVAFSESALLSFSTFEQFNSNVDVSFSNYASVGAVDSFDSTVGFTDNAILSAGAAEQFTSTSDFDPSTYIIANADETFSFTVSLTEFATVIGDFEVVETSEVFVSNVNFIEDAYVSLDTNEQFPFSFNYAESVHAVGSVEEIMEIITNLDEVERVVVYGTDEFGFTVRLIEAVTIEGKYKVTQKITMPVTRINSVYIVTKDNNITNRLVVK